MNSSKFLELLSKAKANKAVADALASQITQQSVTEVDTSSFNDPSEQETVDAIIEAIGVVNSVASPVPEPSPEPTKLKAGVARDIILNAKQQQFNDLVQTGKSCVLIGAAGTGKTTSVRTVSRNLIDSGRIPKLRDKTKWLQVDTPGIAVLSFTRKAVNNIRHAVVDELKTNTLTIHKLLEFAPVSYEIEDPETPGQFKKTMRFEPKRNESNPLPKELQLLIFEESSMIGVDLYNLLQLAMPHEHQEVFLGDIQQLPPVFGKAILGFKMLEFGADAVIELTEVYRQALESPIISLAWKILGGNPHDFSGRVERYDIVNSKGKTVSRIKCPALDALSITNNFGSVKFQVWQKSLSADIALMTAVNQFRLWQSEGYYNQNDDIILCPFNISFGTIELNRGISHYLGVQRNATVYEVIAGFEKHYLAVGDRVLYDKEDYFITNISINHEYTGKRPAVPSANLNRHGVYEKRVSEEEKAASLTEEMNMTDDEIDELMGKMVSAEIEDRVQAASHSVQLRPAWQLDTCVSEIWNDQDAVKSMFELGDDSEDVTIDKAADFNNGKLLGGYAITVHKAQGCEFNKVFLLMHSSHATMNWRELLYTAVTRAKKELHILCETNTFERGVKSQKIKGNTLAEKALIFEGESKKKDSNLVPLPSKGLTTIRGMKAVKLSDLPSTEQKQAVAYALQHYWELACSLWPQLLQHRMPALSFDISSRRMLGKANYTQNTIYINPVWLACSAKDAQIANGMQNVTVAHEVAHIVSWRVGNVTGHGPGWKAVMQKLGQETNATYTDGQLPPYFQSKQELLTELFKEKPVEEEVTEEVEKETELEPEVSTATEEQSPVEETPSQRAKRILAEFKAKKQGVR